MSREQFQTWYRECIYPQASFNMDWDGGYTSRDVQIAWRGWEASRQELEIALPARMNENTQSYERDLANMAFNQAVDDCREAIEAAGVRVKA